MILAQVRVKDGEPFQNRLFNCSIAQFRVMADKRYVAVGKTIILLDIADFLARQFGWEVDDVTR